MLKWGLIVAVLLLLGSIPVFIGLAVVLPWLGYATWHLYTRVVEIEGEPRRPAALKDAAGDACEPPALLPLPTGKPGRPPGGASGQSVYDAPLGREAGRRKGG